MVLFEAAVDAMDKASLANSLVTLASQNTLESQNILEHQLGQPVAKPDNLTKAALKDVHQERIDFTDDGPPSLCHTFTKEYFHSEQRPQVFWAKLCIPLPPNPPDPFEALYDCLVEVIRALANKDNHFAVFPHNLSECNEPNDLLPAINNLDLILDDILECHFFSKDKNP